MVDAAGTVVPALKPMTSENGAVRSITKNVIDYATPPGLLITGANKVAELFGGKSGGTLGDAALSAGDALRGAGSRVASFAVDHTFPGTVVRASNKIAELTGGQGGRSLGESIFGS